MQEHGETERTALLGGRKRGFQRYGLESEAEDGVQALDLQNEQRQQKRDGGREPAAWCGPRTHFRFFVLFWVCFASVVHEPNGSLTFAFRPLVCGVNRLR